MKQKLSIVKIGGNVIEDEKQLERLLLSFSSLEGLKILVHGGGKLATQIAARLGIESHLIGGRRITDAQSLDVMIMVYGGLTNKNIVARLQAINCNAIGMSGADGNTIYAHKRPVREIDYGFAGDVDGVNVETIAALLAAGLVPVFCALTHDKKGQILNTNADTIASEIAIALSVRYKTTLYYCFEKKGVLSNVDDDDSVIQKINSTLYRELLQKNSIADGMLPKMENCYHALKKGVEKVCIGDSAMFEDLKAHYTTLTL